MNKVLLTIDGVVNLFLGALLLFYPAGLLNYLGLPETDTFFYTSILGAVLVGIGLALFVELFEGSAGIRGLGLGGAIAINFCGAGVLLFWLAALPLDIPLRGRLVLWAVALIVFVLAVIELLANLRRQR